MTETKRRGPTLADRFIHRRWSGGDVQLIEPKARAKIQARVRQAHRFVLDEEAAVRLGNVVRDIPELLVREIEFARAPFDVTWIELPHHIYWLAVGGDADGQDGYADHTVGFLIDHNRVNTISGGTLENPNSRHVELLPLQYDLNTEWPHDAQVMFAQDAGISRLSVDAFFWGSSYTEIDPAHRRLLRERNALSCLPLLGDRPTTERTMKVMLEAGSGDLRTVIALLLMLNRPTITRFVNKPSGRGFVRGKLMPYLSHTTVAVDFDAVRTLRLVGTSAGDGVPRRRHEVRGHYCHDKTARDMHRIAGCIHDFQPTHKDWTPWSDAPLDERENWVCSECGGKRWWRAEHERGDAGRGFVVKDGYDVTSRAEQ